MTISNKDKALKALAAAAEQVSGYGFVPLAYVREAIDAVEALEELKRSRRAKKADGKQQT